MKCEYYGFEIKIKGFKIKGIGHLDRITDLIYEAGCDDATVISIGDELTLDFDREASSYDEAVKSAKSDINSITEITSTSLEVVKRL